MKSGIDYVQYSWGPWRGCTKVSPGCDHCYAERDMKRYGHDPCRLVQAAPATFNAPLNKRWAAGSRVFVCPWSDFWHENADLLRPAAWEIIRRRPDLTFLIVTKRPERIVPWLYGKGGGMEPGQTLQNVWHIATCENQDAVMTRLPELLRLREWGAWPVLGVSAEPLLEPLMLGLGLRPRSHGVDWVAAGCESGPNRLHAPIAWFRNLRDQCIEAGVPFYLKQMDNDDVRILGVEFSKKPLLDGRQWLELP